MDKLVEAIGELLPGSKAPHIVMAIYGDTELDRTAKDVLANMFMGLYRAYTKDGRLWVPESAIETTRRGDDIDGE